MFNKLRQGIEKILPLQQAFVLMILFIVYFFFFHIYTASVGQLEIRQACLSRGLPSICADSDALNAASRVSTYSFAFGGAASLFSLALFSAVATKWGRKVMISISCLGFIFAMGGWVVITNTQFGATYWQPIVIITTTAWWCCGGVMGLYLSVFSVIGDITISHAKSRVWFYIIFEALGGVLGIAGAQVVGLVIQQYASTLTIITFFGFVMVILFLYIFMNETCDEELMKQPIVWKKANIFDHLKFIFPTEQSQKIHNDDYSAVYDKMVSVYTQLLSTTHYHQQDKEIIESTSTNNTTDEINSTINHDLTTTRHQSQSEHCDVETAKLYATQIDSEEVYASPHNSLPTTKHGTTSKSNDIINNNINELQYTEQEQIDKDKTKEQNGEFQFPIGLQDFPISPKYTPHTNATLFLVLAAAMYTSNSFCHSLMTLFYAKRVFEVSPEEYANILSATAFIKLATSFLIVPIFRRYFNTSYYQRIIFSIALISLAGCNIWMISVKSWEHFFIVNLVQSLFTVLPSGLGRSLISNQFSNMLQGKVIAALAACETIVCLIGGLLFNLIWLNTSKTHPGVVFLICTGYCIIGAVLPWLMKDSKEDFENRIDLVVLYGKIQTDKKQLPLTKDQENTQDQS